MAQYSSAGMAVQTQGADFTRTPGVAVPRSNGVPDRAVAFVELEETAALLQDSYQDQIATQVQALTPLIEERTTPQQVQDFIAAAQTNLGRAEADTDIAPGQPLRLTINGHADLACASGIGTARICGLATQATPATHSAAFKVDDVLELPNWVAATGGAYLTPGAYYFLDPDNPGRLTLIAPTESGQVVALVGLALSPTAFAINSHTIFLL